MKGIDKETAIGKGRINLDLTFFQQAGGDDDRRDNTQKNRGIMNKDLVVNNTRKKFKGELLDIILNQINNYFELVNSNYQIHHNYNIGDEVILNENH